MKYAVVFERADTGGWGAHAPDLPGLIATGKTIDEARERIREGIAFHIESLRDAGLQIPEPVTRVEEIEPNAA
jgi:predicted RNase H-like HicB family nuclease